VKDLAVLKRIDLREIWPREAADFTPWLARNLDVLGDVLGMELELQGEEVAVGSFSSDILAHDLGRDRPVIIENQLEPTNHDHLGKMLTYAAGYDAGAVIWIAQEVREEHRQAIDWLNQHTDLDIQFYALVVEVLRIDESRPAFHFNLVASPNEWRKERHGVVTGARSERGEAYRAFFQSLIDELREKHRFTNARIGQPQNWYLFSAGITHVGFGINFASDGRFRVEVYIDFPSAEFNKTMFDSFQEQAAELEAAVGDPFEWERLDDKRASRIAIYRQGSIEDSHETLDQIRSWAVDHLLRLKTVFGPRLPILRDQLQQSAAIVNDSIQPFISDAN
jgi:hypothetical protein